MDEKPEIRLVQEVLAGRKESFSALVRLYQDYAYGVAIAVLSDFDLARDVVREAFVCAFRNLRKLKDPSKFGGWLRGIVRHTSLRALRERDRVLAMAEQLNPDTHAVDPKQSPLQAAEDAERRGIVQKALAALNEKTREVVGLYYVNGFSYEEIAGFLGITVTAVQGRLQRGRAKLKKELMNMVEGTFAEKELPDDFAAEIKRLLDDLADGAKPGEETVRGLAEIGVGAVDPLCEALGDPRTVVRQAAARALCQIGDARALRPILRVLYAGDWATANTILRTGKVLRIPGVREELMRIVRQGKPDEQYWAMQALAHAKGDAEVFDCLMGVFRNPLAPDRRQALWALCELRPEAGPELFAEAYEDTQLQRHSIGWIALMKGSLPPLESCLKAFGAEVCPAGRASAAWLALRHGEKGRVALERLLREGGPGERATAALALAAVRHPQAFEVLKQELLSNERRDRKWLKQVSATLGRCFGPEFAAHVLDQPSKQRHAHRLAWTLAHSRTDVTPAVERLAQEGPPAVRAAAVRLLVRERKADSIPELRRRLKEGQPRKVAQEAFRQMRRLGDAALPVALQMLESEHWTERKAAVCLLRHWGKLTAAQRARALADPHVAVRQAVVRTSE
jgi:RNA polymerase sigma-70 factor (ECF subfamily)